MATTTSRSYSTRFYWRLVIAMLWIAAVVAIAFTLFQKIQQSHQANKVVPQQEQPIDLNPDDIKSGMFTKNPDGTYTVHPQPAGWDPNGIEDFRLIDSSGKTVTKQDLLGKPWAVCFVFTSCRHSCPMISQMMKNELQDHLEETDVRLVTMTVDPEEDTPEVLAAYAKQYDAIKDKWIFLTGNKKDVFHLIRNSFKKSTADKRTHTNDILYIDASGVVRGKYDGVDRVDIARLRNVLKKEAKEISHRKKTSTRLPVVAPLP